MPKPTKAFEVGDDEREHPDLVYYRMAGKKRKAHGTWYRGDHTNFHPMRGSLAEPDAVARYVGLGWFPEAPVIDRQHYITAFGSCFASEVTKFLVAEGYRIFGGDLRLNAHIIRSGEGIVNTAALRQQLEWGLLEREPGAAVWFDADGRQASTADEIRNNTRDILMQTDVFIFTLGLSEVWYDKPTGEIFWRAIPSRSFDPERHGFKILSVDENRENLTRSYELVRRLRPDARIILTLSPIPLAATFRPVSCITANTVSKASLRVAIDEVMRANQSDRHLYYFPSYEIVTSFLDDAFGDDLRHPRPETIDFVMDTFRRHYLAG